MLKAILNRPDIELSQPVIPVIVIKPFGAVGIEIIFRWILETLAHDHIVIPSLLLNRLCPFPVTELALNLPNLADERRSGNDQHTDGQHKYQINNCQLSNPWAPVAALLKADQGKNSQW